MVIQIFVLHFCPVMLSSSCANSSAQSVSNYSMPNARPSIQPETMLISKKKVNTRNFSLDFKIGPHLDQGCHIGFFKAKFLELVSRHTAQSNVAQETSSGMTGGEIGDDLFFFFGDHLCNNSEETVEFACFSLKWYRSPKMAVYIHDAQFGKHWCRLKLSF